MGMAHAGAGAGAAQSCSPILYLITTTAPRRTCCPPTPRAAEQVFRTLGEGAKATKAPKAVRAAAGGGGGEVDNSALPDGFEVAAHKTFHRYVVRAGAGGKQSNKDSTGKYAKSAGSRLRRYNEVGGRYGGGTVRYGPVRGGRRYDNDGVWTRLQPAVVEL